jgi:hypothetical protein
MFKAQPVVRLPIKTLQIWRQVHVKNNKKRPVLRSAISLEVRVVHFTKKTQRFTKNHEP